MPGQDQTPHLSESSTSHQEQLLRLIMEGTATATGNEFFKSLVISLATVLEVRYAWVCEFAEVKTRVRTLAFCAGDRCIDNFEYDLDVAPCKNVYESGSLCHYRKGLQQLFPEDKDLVTIGGESYLGVPLIDDTGQILGHMAVIDVKEFPAGTREVWLFHIFAARARAELERLRVEKALQESKDRLAGILESAMDAIITFNDNRRITLFNDAAEKVFKCPAEHAVGEPVDRFLSQKFLQMLGQTILDFTTTDRGYLPEGLTARRSDGEEFPIEATISKTEINKEKLCTIILRDINDRKKAEAEIRKLQNENVYLLEEIQTHYYDLVGASSPIQLAVKNAEKVARTDSTVLLMGETGTGKEVFARTIHNLSKRHDRVMVTVNCAALPSGLVESELFGHEKGAFTGATIRKKGRFEMADGGTIFLDEVGELPLDTQAKILRVMQEQEFERVGATSTTRVDVRVIAATNKDLEEAVKQGVFREDLYYRLNIFPIRIPPLRERGQDVLLLMNYFADKFSRRMGKRIDRITTDAQEQLLKYAWPGNVRELANIIERAVILCEGQELSLEHIGLTSPVVTESSPGSSASEIPTLEESEKQHILRALEKTNGVVGGTSGAAKLLGVNRTTLLSRMKKLGIPTKGN